ncbi:hypothetical protein EAY17_24910, partial [Escherichia coli]|nr:hypothetical protein [Escherichia coli]
SQTEELWLSGTANPHWCDLTLLTINYVAWRTPDTPQKQSIHYRVLTSRCFITTMKRSVLLKVESVKVVQIQFQFSVPVMNLLCAK